MALQDELKNLIKDLQAAGVPTARFERSIERAGKNTEKLSQVAREMRGRLKESADYFSEMGDSASSLYSELVNVVKEINNSGYSLRMARKEFNATVGLARQLADDEQRISDLRGSQVDKLNKEVQARTEA